MRGSQQADDYLLNKFTYFSEPENQQRDRDSFSVSPAQQSSYATSPWSPASQARGFKRVQPSRTRAYQYDHIKHGQLFNSETQRLLDFVEATDLQMKPPSRKGNLLDYGIIMANLSL